MAETKIPEHYRRIIDQKVEEPITFDGSLEFDGREGLCFGYIPEGTIAYTGRLTVKKEIGGLLSEEPNVYDFSSSDGKFKSRIDTNGKWEYELEKDLLSIRAIPFGGNNYSGEDLPPLSHIGVRLKISDLEKKTN